MSQQVRSKNTLFQILTDSDNDDKKAQNRKTYREQNKGETKLNESQEKTRNSQYSRENNQVTESQQRRPWQSKNINATQYIDKNKNNKRGVEKYIPPVNDKMIQKSHEELDVLNIPVSAKQSTSQSEN